MYSLHSVVFHPSGVFLSYFMVPHSAPWFPILFHGSPKPHEDSKFHSRPVFCLATALVFRSCDTREQSATWDAGGAAGCHPNISRQCHQALKWMCSTGLLHEAWGREENIHCNCLYIFFLHYLIPWNNYFSVMCFSLVADKKMMASASTAGNQQLYSQGSPFQPGHSGKTFRYLVQILSVSVPVWEGELCPCSTVETKPAQGARASFTWMNFSLCTLHCWWCFST